MLFILSEKSHFPRISERLIDILKGQPCCRGCDIQFMGQIDTADFGVIRVDAGEQPLGEKLAEWVTGEIWHGAGLDIAREVGLDADAALAQHRHHARIIHRSHRVTDARGAEFFHRLHNTCRAGRLSSMHSDLPTCIAALFEMLHKKPGRFGGLVAGQVQSHEVLFVIEEREKFLPGQPRAKGAREDADEIQANPEIRLALPGALDHGFNNLRRIQVVMRGHEARAEPQLDVANALARGVLPIFLGHTATGVVIRKPGDHPLKFRQTLDQSGVRLGNDDMRPQLSGGPSWKRDIVATPEIKNRLQANGSIQMSMQIDER